jgi:DNA-binding phage protein
MPLTREFKTTVQDRVKRDPAFRDALLAEGIEAMLNGDVDTGKAILRDYINATLGFGPLAEATGSETKNLMRMFGPNGNPTAKNLMAVIGHLQRASGVNLHVKADHNSKAVKSRAA